MADNTAGEGEEQIDLDGDNYPEDMIDDDDAAEDDGYRNERDAYRENYWKERDEYRESPREGREEYGDGYREARYDSTEEEHHFEGEEHGIISPSGGTNDSSGSMKGEDNHSYSKDEEDSQKHAELLALPPHGAEIFIGGIPRDATEEDLRELCEPSGEIFQVKLMKDKDKGENKGFAFVMFTTKDTAQKAIEEIHDKEFKGKKLRCSLSQVKYRLFIGNVPKSLAEEELRKILEENGPGIENIECLKDPQNPSRNRGFLFVEYCNHACADYARQKMSSPNFRMDGSRPTVSWAEPKNATDASAAAQVKVVYVKNLPENITTEKVKELFERHGEVTKVVLPPAKSAQSKRDFGFVHFAERSSALKAVKGTEKYEIEGHMLDVCLAKPQADKKFGYAKPGLLASYPQHPAYGYSGDPYGAYGARYGAAGYGQPMIYGRGLMPAGMKMVPMVLPDGRVGYVLQQPSLQPAPPPRRRDRGSSSSEGRGCGSDGNRGRRYRPY